MPVYRLRVDGHLDESWSGWFDGMKFTHLENRETVIEGAVPDQTALFGVLIKVRDLGLRLIAVNSIEAEPDDTGNIHGPQRDGKMTHYGGETRQQLTRQQKTGMGYR